MMDDSWNWRHVRLFHFLDQPKINELLPLMPVRNLPHGACLYRAGDVSDGLFILCSGAVKLFYITSAGREQIINIIQPGDVLGDFFVWDAHVHLVTAQALEDTAVRCLGSETLARLTERSPCLAVHLLRYIAHKQRQTLRWIQVLLQPVPQDRLLGILFSLADARSIGAHGEAWVALPDYITQGDIANMAALNRSTVSLLINRLRREGILGGRGRTLSINTVRARTALQALGLEFDD